MDEQKGAGLITPDHPLNVWFWSGAVEFAVLDSSPHAQEIRRRFREETGVDVSPLPAPASPIERLVDEACNDWGERLEQFIPWFNANIWGKEWAPPQVERIGTGGAEGGAAGAWLGSPPGGSAAPGPETS